MLSLLGKISGVVALCNFNFKIPSFITHVNSVCVGFVFSDLETLYLCDFRFFGEKNEIRFWI